MSFSFSVMPMLSVSSSMLTLRSLQKIPNKFSRKYGGGVANPVYLKPPDGTEWKVDWTEHDGGILFEKGWKEFATYYSLDHGHLLFFEYKETSHFEVHIFGMSGLEIDYPLHDQITDDSVEILNELPPRRPGRPKKKLKSPMSSPSTSKKLKSATRTRDVGRSLNPQGSQSEETNLEMPIFASANQDLDGMCFMIRIIFPFCEFN